MITALIVYAIVMSFGPSRQRVKSDSVKIAEVTYDKFMEYVDAEGIVQPIQTIQVNALEQGCVGRIVAEEGSLLKQGDTILVIENVELLRIIEDQRDEWEKQQISYREKEIDMERQSLSLQQQALQTEYELSRLGKTIELHRKEHSMGITSKAQLQLYEDEYEYNIRNARLQRETLKRDSAMAVIRRDLIRSDRERESKKYLRSVERLENLVVRAPVDGQLSFVNVTPGQQVAAGARIAEIKVLSSYKVHTSLSEYYIDRISVGLPATVSNGGERYPLRVSKVVPEVKDRVFEMDLVFTDSLPNNTRLGKSFRVQVELGQSEDAVVIPNGDFYQTTTGRWIYKLNKEKTKAVRVPLSIGRQNPQQYEILDGLQPGDWVIVAGYDNFGNAEEIILQ